jgi:hypothetical protein
MEDATVAACKQLKQEKDEAKRSNHKCTIGVFNSIVKAVEQEYELQAGMLKTHTILKRVQRNNVSGKSAANTSPLSEMELILVEYCL